MTNLVGHFVSPIRSCRDPWERLREGSVFSKKTAGSLSYYFMPSPNFHLVPRIWIKFLIFYVNMVGEWKWTSYHVRSWQILNFWNITNTFLHNKIPCLLCPKYAEVNTFVNHFSPEMINNCNKINLTIIWQGSWGGAFVIGHI